MLVRTPMREAKRLLHEKDRLKRIYDFYTGFFIFKKWNIPRAKASHFVWIFRDEYTFSSFLVNVHPCCDTTRSSSHHLLLQKNAGD